MLWVYGYYDFFNSFSAETVCRRQILTSKDGTRAGRVNEKLDCSETVYEVKSNKTSPAHKGEIEAGFDRLGGGVRVKFVIRQGIISKYNLQ